MKKHVRKKYRKTDLHLPVDDSISSVVVKSLYKVKEKPLLSSMLYTYTLSEVRSHWL